MPDIRPPTHASDMLQAALAWLAVPGGDDPLADLAPLRQHARVLLDGELSAASLVELLDLLRPRAAAAVAAARPHLLAATLPLPRPLRSLAKALLDVEGLIAGGCMRIARDADAGELAGAQRPRLQFVAEALAHLAAEHEIALLSSTPTSPGLWISVQSLYHQSRGASPALNALGSESAAAEGTVKAMLALAAAQPEAYTPRQIDLLIRFVARHAAQVEISLLTPDTAGSWYWLEGRRDLPPVAVRRRRPPAEAGCLFFSCAELGVLCGNLVQRLAAGENPAKLDLPAQAAQVDCQAALRQAQIYWSAPPKRLLTRRRNNYPVQVCTDFDSLWHQLCGDAAGSRPELAFATSDWMVINESPGGYAVMNVSGGVNGIQSGGVLGLRPAPDQPWSLCLVRWARSDNPEHLELGLELVAPSAQAVQVASRRTGQPLPALLLPSLSRLDRGESLLAPRGTYTAAGFTLLQETEGRLRIAYCLPGGLWLQTSFVDVYEFERDPLPL